ncbi:hypothetical protein SS50377_25184 [Spironucleus salmonicida]|uniref:Uncharacterized protein n=1 Tax=Spironucleus salmonicida TaxID=348837 RepID=V6LRF7_9EUKA|nr:hypothetical protein SS50377_25184 [Spironucleus salmonicida]|eukprot:EST46843.1 Hypothetical protein SS50377_13107 [Spironucleus salmonicida]
MKLSPQQIQHISAMMHPPQSQIITKIAKIQPQPPFQPLNNPPLCMQLTEKLWIAQKNDEIGLKKPPQKTKVVTPIGLLELELKQLKNDILYANSEPQKLQKLSRKLDVLQRKISEKQ